MIHTCLVTHSVSKHKGESAAGIMTTCIQKHLIKQAPRDAILNQVPIPLAFGIYLYCRVRVERMFPVVQHFAYNILYFA